MSVLGPVDRSLFRVRADLPVRFRDTDGMGHVNNAVYLTYLEVARERYWRTVFDLTDYRKVDIILARVEIDFREPARSGETVVVGLRINRLGRKSFEIDYEGWGLEHGRTVLTARSVQVLFDYESNRSKGIPSGMREKILAFEGPGSVEGA